MRDDYIRLIKNYIQQNPDFKNAIRELQANLVSYGITEQEFDEAVRQLTKPAVAGVTVKPPPEPPKEVINQKKEMEQTKQQLENELLEAKKTFADSLKALQQDIAKEKQHMSQDLKQEIEQNLKQALKETKPSPVDEFIYTDALSDAQKPKSSRAVKKLLMADIASHVVIVILLLFAGVIFGSFALKQYFNKQPVAATSQPQQKDTSGNFVVSPVFANDKVIDADRIFSFPASNVTLAISGTPKKEILGFFPYWMLADQDKVSLNAITSVALFGIDTDGKGNIVTTQSDGSADGGWTMWNDPKLQTFISRVKKRKIKLELTIKNFDNKNIETLIQSDDAQKTFISNALQLISSKSLDGINIDFEYVGTTDQKTRDNFTRFITNLNAELKRQSPHAILTVDTYINSASVNGIFDVTALEENVDALVIMGYDIHTPLGSPGPVAPMEGDVSILGYMQGYLEKVSPDKLILAVPYYGYDWPVSNPTNSSDNVKMVSYAEIASTNQNDDISWDDTAQTPWFRYTDPTTQTVHEVHFENTRSLGVKYDYVNRKNLKGVGIWAMGYDGLNGDLRELLLEKFAQ